MLYYSYHLYFCLLFLEMIRHVVFLSMPLSMFHRWLCLLFGVVLIVDGVNIVVGDTIIIIIIVIIIIIPQSISRSRIKLHPQK